MTVTRKFKAIFVAFALAAAVLTASVFGVSFAKWGGGIATVSATARTGMWAEVSQGECSIVLSGTVNMDGNNTDRLVLSADPNNPEYYNCTFVTSAPGIVFSAYRDGAKVPLQLQYTGGALNEWVEVNSDRTEFTLLKQAAYQLIIHGSELILVCYG